MSHIADLVPKTISAQQEAPLRALAGKHGHLFSNAEVYAFLAAAKQAEKIKDPLQRCLAYPDPPGSHWSHAAANAYCQYRMQHLMPFAELRSLIQNGQAAEVDRRFAQMLDAQSTQLNARGLLDRTFELDFDGSFDIRPTLDAWKRDSPKSAFAYAASGYAYREMAAQARGGAYMADTPASNVESMDRLLQQADTDLRHAIELNPRITPAYVAMIDAGTMSLGDAYADEASRRGLAADPANFGIYDSLLWRALPRWGGSLEAMTQLASNAQAHAKENPILTLLSTKEPAEEINLDDCDCHTAAQLAMYTVVFDQVSTAQLLLSAGHAAESSHHPELAVVYFSEALRFDPDLADERLHRIYELNNFDESQWAVDEASSMMQAAPQDEAPVKLRGYSYEALGDYKHAGQDFEKALSLNPDDESVLMELGSMYAHWSHEWDKAWDTDNRIIKAYPNESYGWYLRGEIQKNQPRAGLQETIDYFAAHFDTNPQAHKMLLQMRAALALQSRSVSQRSEMKSTTHD
ncbi:tetratricopeptide repeat protein [Rhodanobacter sp. C01]|uniref:tetratricopeptide repeat protein n=1 Tax=Rhodanobacter sp. C01 TaxID=1945856 RepID=UPI001C2C2D3B|nr:tetratricopeptide repeat protein [Rhodanobacter sp. C01]